MNLITRLTYPGERFGRLTVIREIETNSRKRILSVECDCGNCRDIPFHEVLSGNTTSCGCRRAEGGVPPRIIKHGATRGAGTTYNSWLSMKGRCLTKGHSKYLDYGGRGITVFPEWIASYVAFVRDVGERPTSDHTLERIENDGNYEPGNVRWATRAEQVRNRRNTVYLDVSGVRELAIDVADRLGIPRNTMLQRIRANMPMDKILLVGRVVSWQQQPRCVCGACRNCRKRLSRKISEVLS